MQADADKYVWDAKEAARRIPRFAAGRTVDEYRADDLLRSAIERQFTVLGEALARLRQVDAATAARITDLPRAVARRNVLVHGYAEIDDDVVGVSSVVRWRRCSTSSIASDAPGRRPRLGASITVRTRQGKRRDGRASNTTSRLFVGIVTVCRHASPAATASACTSASRRSPQRGSRARRSASKASLLGAVGTPSTRNGP